MVISIRRTTPPPSQFVTAIAWLGIVSGALGTLGAAVNTIEVIFSSAAEIGEARAAVTAAAGHLPATVQWTMDHVHLVVFLMLVGSVVSLLTSIGLLRRREWARVAVVWFLGLSAVTAFAGLVVQWRSELDAVASELRVAMVVMFVLLAAVNGLIIAKLSSARIREEFEAADED
jgi:hypothetical protein